MYLPSGQFFGASLRQADLNGLTLTLSGYPAGQRQPWHTHEHPTLFLPLQRSVLSCQRREEEVLAPLTMVYRPADAVHRCVTGLEGVTGLNIEPSSEWLAAHSLTPREFEESTRICSPKAGLTALCLMAQAFFSPEPYVPALEADALEIILALPPSTSSASTASPPCWLRRVESILRDAPEADIRLRDAAQEANVHPVYLARVFRAHYGCSIGDYMRRVRLLRASIHALQTESTLASAACEGGFADQSHFTRQFVRETGLRPGVLLKLRALLPSGN